MKTAAFIIAMLLTSPAFAGEFPNQFHEPPVAMPDLASKDFGAFDGFGDGYDDLAIEDDTPTLPDRNPLRQFPNGEPVFSEADISNIEPPRYLMPELPYGFDGANIPHPDPNNITNPDFPSEDI